MSLPPGDMLAIWSEVKDSGDAGALETFAQNFEGTTLGVLAASRARALREAARQTEIDKNAKDVWAYMRDAGDPKVLEDFAAAFPNNQWAYEALDLAAKMRAETAAKTGVSIQAPELATVDASAAAQTAAADEARAAREVEAARNRGAQRELNRLGYDVGPVDGAFGPRSRAALTAFQQAEGLSPDGELNDTVLAALLASERRAAPPQAETAGISASAGGGVTAPDELPVKISWRLRRGFSGDNIEGSCETEFKASGPVQPDGSRRYAKAHQRCDADNVSYELRFNPNAQSASGEVQVETYEGNSRRLKFSGGLPRLTAALGGSQVILVFSQP